MNEQAANSGSRELLDATQQAVVGAAGNVETIIQDTAEELHGNGEAFYLTAEFWVGMTFVLVVAVLFVPLKKALLAYLGKYAEKEAGRINEAENLKTEARKLLAAYEQKLENLEDEKAGILEKAKKEAGVLKKRALAELDRKMQAQEKSVNERIRGEQSRAESELTSLVTERTIELLKDTLAAKFDDGARAKLIDESIKRIESL